MGYKPQVQITHVRLSQTGEPDDPADFMTHAPIKTGDARRIK